MPFPSSPTKPMSTSFVWAYALDAATICARIDSLTTVKGTLDATTLALQDRLPAELIDTIRYRIWDLEFHTSYQSIWLPSYRCATASCNTLDHFTPTERDFLTENGHSLTLDELTTKERHERNLLHFSTAVGGERKWSGYRVFEYARRIFSATYGLHVYFNVSRSYVRGYMTEGDLLSVKVDAFLTMQADERESQRQWDVGMRVLKPLGEVERRVFVVAITALDLKGEREKVGLDEKAKGIVMVRPKRMQLIDGMLEPAS